MSGHPTGKLLSAGKVCSDELSVKKRLAILPILRRVHVKAYASSQRGHTEAWDKLIDGAGSSSASQRGQVHFETEFAQPPVEKGDLDKIEIVKHLKRLVRSNLVLPD